MPPRTQIDKERVKQLAAEGLPPAAIARRAGCSTAAVYGVLRVYKRRKGR
jgi:DNA invertase Pin-like site-specific DNA recombinase